MDKWDLVSRWAEWAKVEMNTHTLIHTHIYTLIHPHTHTHTHTHILTHLHTHTPIHTHTHLLVIPTEPLSRVGEGRDEVGVPPPGKHHIR